MRRNSGPRHDCIVGTPAPIYALDAAYHVSKYGGGLVASGAANPRLSAAKLLRQLAVCLWAMSTSYSDFFRNRMLSFLFLYNWYLHF